MGTTQDSTPDSSKDSGYAKANAPSISLPKGGGALKSIDEKFRVNPSNGTASFSIPIPLSKSRSDLGPHLSLNYNSGSGNSPFGLGWNIDLPAIHRRTDKLMPRYRDREESDVFQISGAEDLVPAMVKDANGWNPDIIITAEYTIKRYRPRVEGGFARIEKITDTTGNVYWKTTTKDNVVSFYGCTDQAKIADPADASRTFKWLPEFSYDDKGNYLTYLYAQENTQGVSNALHEKNRLNNTQLFTNRYLKNIQYGNTIPYKQTDPYNPAYLPKGTPPIDYQFTFELVLDYGDHDKDNPGNIPTSTWGCRLDAFSDGHACFEIRTYRLCRRFLLFHQFQELGTAPQLVRSLDLSYQHYDFQQVSDPFAVSYAEADYIVATTQVSYIPNGPGTYIQKSLPSQRFSYNTATWNTEIKNISAENIVHAPAGLSSNYQFTDLWGEGISGILTEQAEAWFYKSNLGDGNFTEAQVVAPKPSFSGLSSGTLQLQNLAADGRKFLVNMQAPVQGYFELTDTGSWLPFQAFSQYPNVDIHDPNVKFIDLNGDGMADLVISQEQVFTWYPAAGVAGYDAPEFAPKPFDEEKGPALVFRDPVESVFLSDMNGDGLTDIVRIRNGEICYWPNLGYGIFGAKVNMSNAPVFDQPDLFNPAYLHLADVSGTGATDIIYLGKNRFRAWLNLSGNAWSEATEINPFPGTALPNQVAVADLLGNGTACIVWSSPLPGNADAPLRYIDLMGGNKPYIMNGYTTGMGKEVSFAYKSSSYYYLQDKMAGMPWITKLPFPVQCVAATTTKDTVAGTSYTNSYSYHHGYYDHPEREFRGFGRVEQTDIETFDFGLDQAPVLTKTWFHTGAFFDEERILNQFAQEYYQNTVLAEYQLLQPQLPPGLTADEMREALRACKGMTLRQEVYALDGDQNPVLAPHPYSTAEHNCNIQLLQPTGGNLYAVFLMTESEAITYHYERNPADPRIAHTFNLETDLYGNTVLAASVVYPRQPVGNPLTPGGFPLPGGQSLPANVLSEQQKTYITCQVNAYTSYIQDTDYRHSVPYESIGYEITALRPDSAFFTFDNFHTQINNILSDPHSTQKKRLKHQRILFTANDHLTQSLPLGTMQSLGIPYQTYHLVLTDTILSNALNSMAADDLLTAGGYQSSADLGFPLDPSATAEWWVSSGSILYPANPAASFYLPLAYLDPFGNRTSINYDAYLLNVIQTTDAIGNTTTAVFDYRVMVAQKVTDINNNITVFSFDILGLVVGTALMAKGDGTEGDNLDRFTADLDDATILAFFGDPLSNGLTLLSNATTRFVYDFPTELPVITPARTAIIVRENHVASTFNDGRVPIDVNKLQYSFEYTDGMGRLAMKKVQAEPEYIPGSNTASPPRWLGTGKTIWNNKGKAVKQYEPFFSPTPLYEEAPTNGVTPILHYDPTGRLVQSDFPDGTLARTEFDAWMEIVYDQNDLVLDSDCRWYPANTAATATALQKSVAAKAAVHAHTPTVNHYDSLGRNFYSVALNKKVADNTFLSHETQTVLDIEGNHITVLDDIALKKIKARYVMDFQYNLLNQPVYQNSMDAGKRWMLTDCMNKPFHKWAVNNDINSSENIHYYYEYDKLHRPVKSYYGPANSNDLAITDQVIYGEGQTNDTVYNLRGKIYQQYDGAGLVTHALYDFKGNAVQSSRVFVQKKQVMPLWGSQQGQVSPAALEAEGYVSISRVDALNRPIIGISPFKTGTPYAIVSLPYNTANVSTANIIVPAYSTAGLLTKVDSYLRGDASATSFVQIICHNEKGQRSYIRYGNSVVSKYHYDPETFRLSSLVTTRKTDPGSGAIDTLQDLSYTYDPVGNITNINDAAQTVVYAGNQQINPSADYTYDAIYRLINATGRERKGNSIVPTTDDAYNLNAVMPPLDYNQLQNYTQQYSYDGVGNMMSMNNTGSWNRIFNYAYNTANTHKYTGNQLINTNPGDTGTTAFTYSYDAHGNMTCMQHLSQMDWNAKDQLQHVNLGGGGAAYYLYDGGGQRACKQWVKNNSLTCTRLYLGNFELYTEDDGKGNESLTRESLHVMDDQQRIALVETKTTDNNSSDTTPLNQPLTRYQHSNHLGSACLEVDQNAQLVSYEEYYPFGSTSYQAQNKAINPVAKRYRYTGMERDEESGLEYHSARYYAPWLGRWTAADPIGIGDGLNVYAYVKNNPIVHNDPTGMADSDREKGTSETEILSPSRDIILDIPPNANASETRVFEAAVGSLKDSSPPPMTPKERMEDRNFFTKEHDDAVKKVINTALTIAIQHFTDPKSKKIIGTKLQIIDFALLRLVVPLRLENNENGQSLIFRDADHYFTGLRQEWQNSDKVYSMLDRKETKELHDQLVKGRAIHHVPSRFLSLFSSFIDYEYDQTKISKMKEAVANGNTDGSSSIDSASSHPASAAGGRQWGDLGNDEFFADYDSLLKKEAPSLVVETPFDIFQEEEQIYRHMILY